MLDRLMHRVLVALNMASGVPSSMGWAHASATTRVSSSRSEAVPPRGPVVSDAERLARRYRGARDDATRRIVIQDALDELRSVRYSRRGKNDALKEARLEIGRDKRPASVVAYVYGYHRSHIYRLRAEAAREDHAAA